MAVFCQNYINLSNFEEKSLSHPLWMRGLKFRIYRPQRTAYHVASFMDAPTINHLPTL